MKFFSPKQHFNLTKTGNKRNKRSRRGQSPSLERELSTSEIETSQGNETVIETLCNFENVSSVRNEEIAEEHNPYQTDDTENKTPPEQGPQNTQVMRTVKKTHLSQKTKNVKYRIILSGHLF